MGATAEHPLDKLVRPMTQRKLNAIVSGRVAAEQEKLRAKYEPYVEECAVLREALDEAAARVRDLEAQLGVEHRTTSRDLTASVVERVAARLAEAAAQQDPPPSAPTSTTYPRPRTATAAPSTNTAAVLDRQRRRRRSTVA